MEVCKYSLFDEDEFGDIVRALKNDKISTKN